MRESINQSRAKALNESYTIDRGAHLSRRAHAPMIPHGKHLSMRIFPSTLTTRCIKIVVTSLYVSAYFNRFRRMRHSGRHSRDLWGPVKDEQRRETTRARSIGQSIRLLFLIPRVHHERDIARSPRSSSSLDENPLRASNRTWRRFRGEDAAELVQHPVLGRIKTL